MKAIVLFFILGCIISCNALRRGGVPLSAQHEGGESPLLLLEQSFASLQKGLTDFSTKYDSIQKDTQALLKQKEEVENQLAAIKKNYFLQAKVILF